MSDVSELPKCVTAESFRGEALGALDDSSNSHGRPRLRGLEAIVRAELGLPPRGDVPECEVADAFGVVFARAEAAR